LAGGDRSHIYDVIQLRFGQPAARTNVLYGLTGLVSSGIGVMVWRGASTILGIAWLAVLSILVVLLYRKSQS
jgi:hypothetical protein